MNTIYGRKLSINFGNPFREHSMQVASTSPVLSVNENALESQIQSNRFPILHAMDVNDTVGVGNERAFALDLAIPSRDNNINNNNSNKRLISSRDTDICDKDVSIIDSLSHPYIETMAHNDDHGKYHNDKSYIENKALEKKKHNIELPPLGHPRSFKRKRSISLGPLNTPKLSSIIHSDQSNSNLNSAVHEVSSPSIVQEIESMPENTSVIKTSDNNDHGSCTSNEGIREDEGQNSSVPATQTNEHHNILEKPLPPGWAKQYSSKHQRPYWFNSSTGQSVWEAPT